MNDAPKEMDLCRFCSWQLQDSSGLFSRAGRGVANCLGTWGVSLVWRWNKLSANEERHSAVRLCGGLISSDKN